MRRLAASLKVRLPASLQPADDPPKKTTRPGRLTRPKDTTSAKQEEADIPALVDVAKLKPIDQPDDEGFSKLHRAVMRRKVDQVRQLLDQGADVDVRHRTFLGTPLQYAASTGGLDVAELLIKRGATVDATDSNGRTPLMWAAGNGKADVVKALLDAGADVNRVNRTNWTALHFAADKGQLDTAQLLIERGADLAAQSSDGKTPGEINPNVRPRR